MSKHAAPDEAWQSSASPLHNDSYNHEFYSHRDAATRKSANALLAAVRGLIAFDSVVDVGCGVGTWLAVAKEQGATRILGFEGPWLALEHAVVPPERIRLQDLREPIDCDERFDIAMCLEVAEHLPEGRADVLIDTLVGLAPVVLFSAAVPFQGGTDHLNEQWPEYWAERFASRGYRAVDAIRPLVWCRRDVRLWYAQNALLYVAEQDIMRWPVLADIATRTDPACLARIHPTLYEQNSDIRRLSLRTLLQLLPQSLVRAVRSRMPWGRR